MYFHRVCRHRSRFLHARCPGNGAFERGTLLNPLLTTPPLLKESQL